MRILMVVMIILLMGCTTPTIEEIPAAPTPVDVPTPIQEEVIEFPLVTTDDLDVSLEALDLMEEIEIEYPD